MARLVTVQLEVDADAAPIQGVLTPAGQEARAFVGWLGLAAGLEQLLELPAAGEQEA